MSAGNREGAEVRARNQRAQSWRALFPGTGGRGNPEQSELFLLLSGGVTDGLLPSVLIRVGAEAFSLLSLL